MGLFDGLKEKLFGRWVGGKARDAEMGRLGGAAKWGWEFLSGWKSWVVAVVAVYKLVCHACATSGYLDAALSAVGWDQVTGAFDPKEAALALGVVVALGHRLWKAIQQYRAGRPVEQLLSEAPRGSLRPASQMSQGVAAQQVEVEGLAS